MNGGKYFWWIQKSEPTKIIKRRCNSFCFCFLLSSVFCFTNERNTKEDIEAFMTLCLVIQSTRFCRKSSSEWIKYIWVIIEVNLQVYDFRNANSFEVYFCHSFGTFGLSRLLLYLATVALAGVSTAFACFIHHLETARNFRFNKSRPETSESDFLYNNQWTGYFQLHFFPKNLKPFHMFSQSWIKIKIGIFELIMYSVIGRTSHKIPHPVCNKQFDVLIYSEVLLLILLQEIIFYNCFLV